MTGDALILFLMQLTQVLRLLADSSASIAPPGKLNAEIRGAPRWRHAGTDFAVFDARSPRTRPRFSITAVLSSFTANESSERVAAARTMCSEYTSMMGTMTENMMTNAAGVPCMGKHVQRHLNEIFAMSTKQRQRALCPDVARMTLS
ncbi:MAG TPA: hypothetical protein VJV79_14250 [Polyangiaceae bacterium]|nr:hypothetical protein [Polyangiaceae bacterium]